MEIPGEWPQEQKDDKKPQATQPVTHDTTPEKPSDKTQTKPEQEDKYEIRLNSYQVVDILGKVAIHHEVAFYRNGEPMLAVNGYAHNNQTGEHSTTALAPGNTLRATVSENLHDGKMVHSVSLGTMDRESMMEKMKAVVAASKFINDNKIEYVAMGGITFEAQNSNSIAVSLVKAMGYDYPEKEYSKFWAPGTKRPLLPDDWQNQSGNQTLAQMKKDVSAAAVTAQIKQEKNPIPIFDPEANTFPSLFDPNQTSVQYAKIEQQKTMVASRSNIGFSSASDVAIASSHNLTGVFSNAVHASGAETRFDVNNPNVAVAANPDHYRTYAMGGPS